MDGQTSLSQHSVSQVSESSVRTRPPVKTVTLDEQLPSHKPTTRSNTASTDSNAVCNNSTGKRYRLLLVLVVVVSLLALFYIYTRYRKRTATEMVVDDEINTEEFDTDLPASVPPQFTQQQTHKHPQQQQNLQHLQQQQQLQQQQHQQQQQQHMYRLQQQRMMQKQQNMSTQPQQLPQQGSTITLPPNEMQKGIPVGNKNEAETITSGEN